MFFLWLLAANLILPFWIMLPINIIAASCYFIAAFAQTSREGVLSFCESYRFGFIRRELNKWRNL